MKYIEEEASKSAKVILEGFLEEVWIVLSL